MLRKLFIFISMAVAFATAGCVKEYDMNTLSKKAHFSPTFGVSAFRGNISLSDLIDPTDTVVFGNDKSITIVFRKDSIIDFKLDDNADFNKLAEFHFNEGYQLSPLTTTNVKDTITYDPGNDIKIEKLIIITGGISYTVKSKSLKSATFTVTFPTVLRAGIPVTQNIVIPALQTVSGFLSLNTTEADFSKDLKKKYNRLPVSYAITASAGSFNLNDSMYLKLDMTKPDFDYIKGYFGQQTETLENDTVDLEIKDILDHITGEFLIANPSIALNYTNSFGLPVKIDLKATGYKMTDSVSLDLDPVLLSYPLGPNEREVEDIFSVNRLNSKLPQLVSMPPEKIRFSGSVKMNPDNTNTMDNYIFGGSRFTAGLEIKVPMEFRMNNLTFTETTDNFLKIDDGGDNPVNPEDFEFLRIKIEAENGFPVGFSLSLALHDSASNADLCVINASDILTPAPVDSDGKVTAPASCSTNIDITRDFWESINIADKIIFKFTINTANSDTQDVKIYSDYKIDFKAALALKPDIKFNLK